MEKMENMNKDDLIKIALEAMKKAEDVKVNGNNLDVLVVGKNDTVKILKPEEIDNFLSQLDDRMDIA